jgi:hypothetical protein
VSLISSPQSLKTSFMQLPGFGCVAASSHHRTTVLKFTRPASLPLELHLRSRSRTPLPRTNQVRCYLLTCEPYQLRDLHLLCCWMPFSCSALRSPLSTLLLGSRASSLLFSRAFVHLDHGEESRQWMTALARGGELNLLLCRLRVEVSVACLVFS